MVWGSKFGCLDLERFACSSPSRLPPSNAGSAIAISASSSASVSVASRFRPKPMRRKQIAESSWTAASTPSCWCETQSMFSLHKHVIVRRVLTVARLWQSNVKRAIIIVTTVTRAIARMNAGLLRPRHKAMYKKVPSPAMVVACCCDGRSGSTVSRPGLNPKHPQTPEVPCVAFLGALG